jgi:peptide/nickel transport system permease protein
MYQFLLKRFLLGIFTVFAISVISFLIIQLPPGDFVDRYVETLLGAQAMGTELAASIEADLRVEYGLDKPGYIQYLKWMNKVVRGNFGFSLEYQKPVWDVVQDRLVNTIILAGGTIVLTWGIALPIGIYSAVRHNSPEDYGVTFLGFLGLAIPDFLLALALMWISFFWFDASVGGLFSSPFAEAAWFYGGIWNMSPGGTILAPELVSGCYVSDIKQYVDCGWNYARAWDMLKHLWIPAVVLGTAGTASLVRIMRNNLLDELSKPYVITARSKGMSEWRLIIKYPVRVALNPLISTIGYILPFLISGSVIVSVVLALPTVGPLLLAALLSEDLFMAATIIFLLGVMTVIGTLISDILLGIMDPRIRIES